MFRKLIIIVALITFTCGSVFSQDTGGDKRRLSRNSAQPPDPLVLHKSPGRSKRSKRRHHKPTPDALTVKQKTKNSKQ